MNIIKSKNILLEKVKKEHIEMIRIWRNSYLVKQWMEYQDEITIDQQEKWFSKLDSNQHFYVIKFNNELIGLVNIKNVNNHTGEGGIFIGSEKHLNGMQGIEALIAMYDFGFNELKLKKITARILFNNKRAIRLNSSLGFIKKNNQEGIINQEWELLQENFLVSTEAIRKYLSL